MITAAAATASMWGEGGGRAHSKNRPLPHQGSNVCNLLAGVGIGMRKAEDYFVTLHGLERGIAYWQCKKEGATKAAWKAFHLLRTIAMQSPSHAG